MCDVAYALLVERVQQERQVGAVLLAAGAEGDLPSIEALDLALGMVEAQTVGQDAETVELRIALGVSA